MKDSEIKGIVRTIVKENEYSTNGQVMGSDEMVDFELEKMDDHSLVTVLGKKYKVTGTDRLKVVVYKEKKIKEKLPDKIDKVCTVCGKSFTVSKFNHYFDKCPECRKNTASKVTNTCVRCGKSFEISKFTPYIDICPDCKAAEKPEKPKKQEEKKKEKSEINI